MTSPEMQLSDLNAAAPAQGEIVREAQPSNRMSWQVVALFVIPLTLPVSFRLVGQLLITEVLLLFCLPLVAKKRIFRNKLPRAFLLLGAIWFLGQAGTDLIRQSAPVDLARGWAGIFFFCTDFIAIYGLIDGRRRRLAIFALGLALGGIGKGLLAPGERLTNLPLAVSWKFGLGQSVSLLALTLPFFHFKLPAWRVTGLIAPFVLAPIHLLLNARSLAGIVLGAGTATLFRRVVRLRRLSLKPVLLIGGICLGTLWGIGELYSKLAANGSLGPAALSKYEKQTRGTLNLLLAGRSDLLGSIPAIIDSPILGHGSWARDIRYELMRLAALESAGYEIGFIDDRIPTHSALFGAWVQAGILGAVFWLWVLQLALRAGLRMFLSPSSLPLAAYMMAALTWDTLFSPCAMDQRIFTSMYVSCAMLLLEKRM